MGKDPVEREQVELHEKNERKVTVSVNHHRCVYSAWKTEATVKTCTSQ